MAKDNTSFTQVSVSKTLKTKQLLAECIDLTPEDQYGRTVPAYGVMHQALMEYRQRLIDNGAEPSKGRKG